MTARKMLMNVLALSFVIGLSCSSAARERVPSHTGRIGFACGVAASPSETVKAFTRKLENREYDWIAGKLTSEDSAERYLSVIALEKLVELGEYSLAESELALITEIKKSTDVVSVCSGCTCSEKIQLEKLFAGDMAVEADHWLNRHVKASDK